VNKLSDKKQVICYIKEGIETEYVDFKQSFYTSLKNSDIIKDVSAFANSSSIDKDKYIIFGIRDNPREVCGIDKTPIPDISNIENLLREKVKPYISISLNSFEYRTKSIAYIKISKDNIDQPYTIDKDCGSNSTIKKGDIYIRKGTCNVKATREDLDNFYNNKNKKGVEIYSDYIRISPIRLPESTLYDQTFGQISLEIINHSSKPFLLCGGYITIRNEYSNIRREIYDILPKYMISENPFEVPANSQFQKNVLFQFTSSDCVSMRLSEEGSSYYETSAKTIFFDTDKNEYESKEIKVNLKASGDVLHKIKLLYSKTRSYLKKNEKLIIKVIISHKNNELKKLLDKNFLLLSFITPVNAENNPDFPEYDIIHRIIKTAIESNNLEALEILSDHELRDELIGFASY